MPPMVHKWSTPEAEISHLNGIIDRQAKELDAQSARLRSAWIERDRLLKLLTDNGIDIGTPTPEMVPIINKSSN